MSQYEIGKDVAQLQVDHADLRQAVKELEQTLNEKFVEFDRFDELLTALEAAGVIMIDDDAKILPGKSGKKK